MSRSVRWNSGTLTNVLSPTVILSSGQNHSGGLFQANNYNITDALAGGTGIVYTWLRWTDRLTGRIVDRQMNSVNVAILGSATAACFPIDTQARSNVYVFSTFDVAVVLPVSYQFIVQLDAL